MIHHVMMINGIEGIRLIMGRKVGNMIEFHICMYIYKTYLIIKKIKLNFLLVGVKKEIEKESNISANFFE